MKLGLAPLSWVLALASACAVSPRQVPVAAPPAAGEVVHAPQVGAAVEGDPAVVSRMIAEGTQRSRVRGDLEYLLDVIGPRLSGTPEKRRSNEWTAQRFRDYGADSAWLEPFRFGVGWQRGPMSLRMLEPQRRELLGVSWAWSPGTNGPVAGPVVLMDARTEAQFRQRFAGRLRGAWVLLGPAAVIPNPHGPPLTAADSIQLDSVRRAQFIRTEDEQRFLSFRQRLLAGEGIAGVLRDGAKSFGLFTMSGSPSAITPYPQIVIANDTYAQLERLARRAGPVRVEAEVRNTFTRDTLEQWNTVAEIRGRELPHEVVLLGAHLDSWDLGTGGSDNGAASIAVLEAARLIAGSGVRPRRTIRFVLFGAEEQGLFGSRAYVERHLARLGDHQAALVLDNGTGRITGMALQGQDELREVWEQLFVPLHPLGPFTVRSANKTGTDHLPFLWHGVPGFNYDQLSRGYDFTYHSQIDTYDYTVPEDVAQAATVMAVQAFLLADMVQRLPRREPTR